MARLGTIETIYGTGMAYGIPNSSSTGILIDRLLYAYFRYVCDGILNLHVGSYSSRLSYIKVLVNFNTSIHSKPISYGKNELILNEIVAVDRHNWASSHALHN